MHTVDAKGLAIPALGFGTWRLEGSGARRAVETALAVGYRHIDTAQIYGNEAEVGAAIAASGLPREDVFLTTKVWPSNFERRRFLASVEDCLRKLKVERVDLLLLHWPRFPRGLSEAIELLVEARERGFANGIGVSNFNKAQVREAVAVSGGTIVANQVEYHPFLDQRPMLELLRGEGMALTAYSPLAQGRIVDEPTIAGLAQTHRRTPAQITLRWLLQQPGVIAIPKAAGETRMRENLDVFSFELSADDMHAIDRIGAPTGRLISPADYAPDWAG